MQPAFLLSRILRGATVENFACLHTIVFFTKSGYNEIANGSALLNRKKLTSRMHKMHAHPLTKVFAFHWTEIANGSALLNRKKLTSRMHKMHAHPLTKVFAFH